MFPSYDGTVLRDVHVAVQGQSMIFNQNLPTVLYRGSQISPLYYIAVCQIGPLFHMAENSILHRQVKFENFEKLSWL